jgi:hypothetical protein
MKVIPELEIAELTFSTCELVVITVLPYISKASVIVYCGDYHCYGTDSSPSITLSSMCRT